MQRIWTALMGLIVIAGQAGAQPATAPDSRIVSGVYEDSLLIGFDPATGVVSGYFNEERGEQPSFSCIFYLKGPLQGAEAPIETWFPETPADDVVKGRLAVSAQGRLQIGLQQEHGGCWNVQHFADSKDPAEFSLHAARPWRSIAVVKSGKAYFFDTPASPAHRKAYLVKGDGVGVRAARPGWLQVDFVGGARQVSGWIRQSDVYPARP